MQGQSDTSSLGKACTNPAINQTTPNNKRNNNDLLSLVLLHMMSPMKDCFNHPKLSQCFWA
jgi:hypothetical protein